MISASIPSTHSFPTTSFPIVPAAQAGGVLTIDLDAVAANYLALRERVAPAHCAAVVKADAYGLGAERVGPVLVEAGCRHFFVAHLDEGIRLRRVVSDGAMIAVLNGPMPGTEPLFTAHDLLPVLNSLEQVAGWTALARQVGHPLRAALQVDTGMARFGLSAAEVETLAADQDALGLLDLAFVMSHLACADEPANPANAAQLDAFRGLLAHFPGIPASLAASSGVFLGRDYHFDLVRPGAALYGIAPQPGVGGPNPMRPVVRLEGRVIQVRTVPAGTPVGYGHTARAAGRLATVAVGYADGYHRSASNQGVAWYRGHRLPVVGRVSMDCLILDAGALPEGALKGGDLVELIGERGDIDAAARAAGTIGYELLTALGSRYHRTYLEARSRRPS